MFGMNLKTLRAENNLTQKNLAEKLLVSRQAVCMWERGARIPRIRVLTQIAGFFGVSLDHIVNTDHPHGSMLKKQTKRKKGVIEDE